MKMQSELFTDIDPAKRNLDALIEEAQEMHQKLSALQVTT